MSTQLPSHPSLENLRKQAKALLKSVRAGDEEEVARVRDKHPDYADASIEQIIEEGGLSDAQWVIAKEHRFESWAKLKEYVITEAAPLEQAIRDDDIAKVVEILKANPKLMKGDIPWQDCRGDRTLLWYATWRGSLGLVEGLLNAGYDLAPDGAEGLGMALSRGMIDVADFLVSRGVNPRGQQDVLFQLTENLNPDAVRWMLGHGANPDYRNPAKEDGSWTPLDNAIHTYPSLPKRRQETIGVLLDAGAEHADNALFDLLSGRRGRMRERIEAERGILNAPFDIGANRNQSLEFGAQYGGAPLKNTTLLHHCAEFGFEEEARLLIDMGADVNARATPDADGFSTHTPIFNTLTTNANSSFGVLELLLQHGADVGIRADLDLFIWERTVRGERCQLRGVTPMEYIALFPNDYHKSARPGDWSALTELDTEPHAVVVELLRRHGG